MKINIKKQENDRDFYNELMYISTKYPTMLKKPETKVHNVTKTYGLYILLALAVLIIVACIYIKINNIALLILLINMILLFLISIYYYIDMSRFINNNLKDENDASLTINNSGVRITRGKTLDYSIEFKDIKYVLINKYCVCFLPYKKTSLMIGVNSIYKENIIKELKELKKDKLIVDNSDHYN